MSGGKEDLRLPYGVWTEWGRHGNGMGTEWRWHGAEFQLTLWGKNTT